MSTLATPPPQPPARRPAARRPAAPDAPLVQTVDVLLLDLDGTVYRGGSAIEGAADTVRACADREIRAAYVTNNASRYPKAIAEQLTDLGIPTEPDDVVTSAQAGARLLATLVPAGTRVLVVGSPHLADEIAAAGLTAVSTRGGADPAGDLGAVIQGFDPELGWHDLAAAAYALTDDVPWVATNVDLTIPTASGIAPGNGSLVNVVAAVAGRRPAVAGKPERPLLDQALERTGATTPLVVGDRLDTDIEAGVRAGLSTLLVLTGVSGPADLVSAPSGARPTHVAADLCGLLEPALVAEDSGDGTWTCGGWTVHVTDDRTTVEGSGDRVAGLWALANTCWAVADDGRQPPADTAAALDRIGWPAGGGPR